MTEKVLREPQKAEVREAFLSCSHGSFSEKWLLAVVTRTLITQHGKTKPTENPTEKMTEILKTDGEIALSSKWPGHFFQCRFTNTSLPARPPPGSQEAVVALSLTRPGYPVETEALLIWYESTLIFARGWAISMEGSGLQPIASYVVPHRKRGGGGARTQKRGGGGAGTGAPCYQYAKSTQFAS